MLGPYNFIQFLYGYQQLDDLEGFQHSKNSGVQPVAIRNALSGKSLRCAAAQNVLGDRCHHWGERPMIERFRYGPSREYQPFRVLLRLSHPNGTQLWFYLLYVERIWQHSQTRRVIIWDMNLLYYSLRMQLVVNSRWTIQRVATCCLLLWFCFGAHYRPVDE